MFNESTQKTNWLFESVESLNEVRSEKYAKISNAPITWQEEMQVLLWYDRAVRQFCDACKPRIPRPTMSTACAYLKRLYLKHTIIEYPVEMYYRTCIYLACKVDEFNLTADDFRSIFVAQGSSPDQADFLIQQILSTELSLISLLDFCLIVHSPYRPMEGFVIAMKQFFVNETEPKEKNTDRDQHIRIVMKEVDGISCKAANFILWSLATDMCLLHAPSQIALSALVYASKNSSLDVFKFITSLTVDSDSETKLVSKLHLIINVVKALKLPSKEAVQAIMLKLEKPVTTHT